jgi:predicted nucleic acid-binding protein
MSLEHRLAILPPMVVTEILSDPELLEETIRAIDGIPLIPLAGGFWTRAGLLRSKVIAGGHKAKVADALIAQCCLDHNLPLVTNDGHFRHFTPHGLQLFDRQSSSLPG